MSTSPAISEPVWRGIDQIVPYWRNPRRVTEEAVNAVAESIKRYGYQQPIVVDEKNVIIIGHTRYAAMRRMKRPRVQVVVATGMSESKVKQLRVIDNRAGEFASWEIDQLMSELRDLDAELMMGFFPEASILDGIAEPTLEELQAVEAIAETKRQDYQAEVAKNTEFVCPSCFHEWQMDVDKSVVLAGGTLQAPGAPALKSDKEASRGAA